MIVFNDIIRLNETRCAKSKKIENILDYGDAICRHARSGLRRLRSSRIDAPARTTTNPLITLTATLFAALGWPGPAQSSARPRRPPRHIHIHTGQSVR